MCHHTAPSLKGSPSWAASGEQAGRTEILKEKNKAKCLLRSSLPQLYQSTGCLPCCCSTSTCWVSCLSPPCSAPPWQPHPKTHVPVTCGHNPPLLATSLIPGDTVCKRAKRDKALSTLALQHSANRNPCGWVPAKLFSGMLSSRCAACSVPLPLLRLHCRMAACGPTRPAHGEEAALFNTSALGHLQVQWMDTVSHYIEAK